MVDLFGEKGEEGEREGERERRQERKRARDVNLRKTRKPERRFCSF